MKYRKIKKGNFIERPNRFIAYVNVEGEENNPQIVHVKNTGRCKELLVDNATVFLPVGLFLIHPLLQCNHTPKFLHQTCLLL